MHVDAADIQPEPIVQIDHASLLMHLQSVLTMHMLCGTVSPEHTYNEKCFIVCALHIDSTQDKDTV